MTPKQLAAELNRLLAVDPEALGKLFPGRVPCNAALAHDERVISASPDGLQGPYSLDALDLFSGLLFRKERVTPIYKSNGGDWKLAGFQVIPR